MSKLGTCTGGLPSERIRRANLGRVLQAIHLRGSISRSELATQLALSPATASRAVHTLLELGYVQELKPEEREEAGRRKTPISIDGEHNMVLSVHIGILRTTIGLVSMTGEVAEKQTLDLRPDGALEAVKILLEKYVIEDQASSRIRGIGIATEVHTQADAGRLASMHEPISPRAAKAEISRHFPAYLVEAATIPTAAALAEFWLTQSPRPRTLLYLYVAALAGVALLIDGSPSLTGQPIAGSIDHIQVPEPTGMPCHCGRPACFAATAGNLGLIAKANSLINKRQPFSSLKEVLDAAAESPQLLALLNQRARNIAYVAGVLADIFGSEALIIGGDAAALVPEYLQAALAPHLRITTPSHRTAGPVSISPIDRDGPVLGPAALIIAKVLQDPACVHMTPTEQTSTA